MRNGSPRSHQSRRPLRSLQEMRRLCLFPRLIVCLNVVRACHFLSRSEGPQTGPSCEENREERRKRQKERKREGERVTEKTSEGQSEGDKRKESFLWESFQFQRAMMLKKTHPPWCSWLRGGEGLSR